MAVRNPPLFSWGLTFDDSGFAYPVPLHILTTNQRWSHQVCAFENGGAASVFGQFYVPANFVSTTVDLVLLWATSLTAGDVRFVFDYRAIGGDDTESVDQAGQQESVSGVQTAASAAWEKRELVISLTGGNLTVDDFVQFELSRDPAHASDTLAGTAVVLDAFLQFA